MNDQFRLIEAYLTDLRAGLRLRGLPSSDVTDEVYDHLVAVAEAAIERGHDPITACGTAMARLGTPSTLAARFAAAKESAMNRFILPIAMVCGLAIGWIDSRPGWDDSGITAGLLLVAGGLITLVSPRRVWLTAIGVGIWIPLTAIVRHGISGGTLAMLLVLLFPLAGAYGALGIRKLAAKA